MGWRTHVLFCTLLIIHEDAELMCSTDKLQPSVFWLWSQQQETNTTSIGPAGGQRCYEVVEFTVSVSHEGSVSKGGAAAFVNY